MTKLVFNGGKHQISVIDQHGKLLGHWTAYNNVDSHASLSHIPNGSYVVQDRVIPHPHVPDAEGPYGLHGIIRFHVPGHVGIGLHAGQAHNPRRPGPAHWTMGCIRTTDQAMQSIAAIMAKAPLSTIEVMGNSPANARSGTSYMQHATAHG